MKKRRATGEDAGKAMLLRANRSAPVPGVDQAEYDRIVAVIQDAIRRNHQGLRVEIGGLS